MNRFRVILITGSLAFSTQAQAADQICAQLKTFVKDQIAEKAEPAPRHWVEFHWEIDPDPNAFWSWGCRPSEDLSSKRFCAWLMENTSREFRNMLPVRVLRCMGYRFPRQPSFEWHVSDGEFRNTQNDGSWLILEVSSKFPNPMESAVRISYENVDRRFEPDDLPDIQPLPVAGK